MAQRRTRKPATPKPVEEKTLGMTRPLTAKDRPDIKGASQDMQDKVGALTTLQQIDQLLMGGLFPGDSAYSIHTARQFISELFRRTNQELEAMQEFPRFFPDVAERKIQEAQKAADAARAALAAKAAESN